MCILATFSLCERTTWENYPIKRMNTQKLSSRMNDRDREWELEQSVWLLAHWCRDFDRFFESYPFSRFNNVNKIKHLIAMWNRNYRVSKLESAFTFRMEFSTNLHLFGSISIAHIVNLSAVHFSWRIISISMFDCIEPCLIVARIVWSDASVTKFSSFTRDIQWIRFHQWNGTEATQFRCVYSMKQFILRK